MTRAFHLYARPRRLALCATTALLAAVTAQRWTNVAMPVLFVPRSSVKSVALVILALGMLVGFGLDASLGDLEGLRGGAIRRLRLTHVAVLAPTLAIPGYALARLLGSSWGWHLSLGAASVAALQVIGSHLAPAVPSWAWPVLVCAPMFLLGVDPLGHEPYGWAWLLEPSVGAATFDIALIVCASAMWVLRGGTRIDT